MTLKGRGVKGSAEESLRAILCRCAVLTPFLMTLFSGGHVSCLPGGRVKVVILATTTSLQDTGLLDLWIPLFEAEHPYVVKVIAAGSGKALQMGRRGECDVILSHSPEEEESMVVEGHVVGRSPVMFNEFVIVGPPGDPAGVAGARCAEEAMARIAASGSDFLSRGDDSGTHAKELSLWRRAGVDPSGTWYAESGRGMGDTLRMASERGAYCLSDEGTFLFLREELDLAVLFRGDPSLLNHYHVMVVNPRRWPGVNVEGAEAFSRFVRSERAQGLLLSFGAEEYGKPLFVPAAGEPEVSVSPVVLPVGGQSRYGLEGLQKAFPYVTGDPIGRASRAGPGRRGHQEPEAHVLGGAAARSWSSHRMSFTDIVRDSRSPAGTSGRRDGLG